MTLSHAAQAARKAAQEAQGPATCAWCAEPIWQPYSPTGGRRKQYCHKGHRDAFRLNRDSGPVAKRARGTDRYSKQRPCACRSWRLCAVHREAAEAA